MKRTKRIFAILLVCVLSVSCLSGCGKGKSKSEKGGSTTDIEISYWHAGLGTEFLDNLIAGFKEKHPEYNVYYNASASVAAARAALGLEDTDTVDLYMVVDQYDTTYLEPLDDVLDTTVEGESRSIREKFDPSYLELEKSSDGKYYNLTHGGGMLGFVYNKELFAQAGIEQLPRTTDELALVCGQLSDNDIVPLCHFVQDGYYYTMNEVWFAQYEGVDAYYDFYSNPTKEKFLTQDGRYEMLKVHEKINTPDYVLQGSNSESHVSIQTKFLDGKAAMMLNGSWLSNEMSSGDKMGNFEMMKTPVISSIIDKLETVKSEADLRALIKAIDNVTDGTEEISVYQDGENYKVKGKTVSKADWERVKTARNTMPMNYSGEVCYIPKYSNAKEGAKEFLRYMYSDEGYKIYMDALHIKMPLNLSEGEIDTSTWNDFEKQQLELFNKTECVITDSIKSKHRLFTDGGASPYANQRVLFVGKMCTRNEADRKNANEIWELIKATIEDHYDSDWLENIK